MKKIAIILFLATISVSTAFGQNRKEHEEKIRALKVGYITEKLDLSASEAQKFWPIYNGFEEKVMALREKSHTARKSIDYDNLSEAEAKKIIEDYKKSNVEKNRLYDTYISDLLTVISPKKVVLLKKTEDDFKRKMFEEYRNRRKSSSGKHPNP